MSTTSPAATPANSDRRATRNARRPTAVAHRRMLNGPFKFADLDRASFEPRVHRRGNDLEAPAAVGGADPPVRRARINIELGIRARWPLTTRRTQPPTRARLLNSSNNSIGTGLSQSELAPVLMMTRCCGVS